jgi:hydrogenase nickel incorporation protein HypA/HybF
MHELSITENILEIALRHAKQANAKKINTIYLAIGDLASIVDDSVQFYWDIVAKDTIAERAALNFKRIPTTLQCQECSLRFSPNEDDFSCPDCNSHKIKVVSGNEFYLDAIDVE